MRSKVSGVLAVPAFVFSVVSAVVLLSLGAPLSALQAQQPTAAAAVPAPRDTVVEVRLRDGSVLYGRVVEDSPERIVIVTVAGVRLELPRAQVESIRVSSGRTVEGGFWAEDPNSTRLFFTSTARPLRKGEGYVSSFMLFLPLVAYGATVSRSPAGRRSFPRRSAGCGTSRRSTRSRSARSRRTRWVRSRSCCPRT